MRHGILRVAAASPRVTVADCKANARQIRALMERAQNEGVKLLVTPELSLTGYTCGDLFFQAALQTAAVDALLWLARESRGLHLAVVAGLPLLHGGKLFNCAAVLCNGSILGVVPKRHIPNYSEFYELRHFSPASAENGDINLGGQAVPLGGKLLFACREVPDFIFGAEICEDLWVPSPPSLGHAAAGATVIANLSASDETVDKEPYRRSLVSMQSAKLPCAYLYADAGDGESTTDLVFSGHNLIAQNGRVLQECPPFGSGWAAAEIDVELLRQERARMSVIPPYDGQGYLTIPFSLPLCDTELRQPISRTPFIPNDPALRRARAERILRIQSEGLKQRLRHTDASYAVVGLSGGLDSTLALLVCVRAAKLLGKGPQSVLAVSMPGFGTSARTRNNARTLAKNIGASFREIDIAAAVRLHFADLGHDETVRDVLYENAQARERTQVLMDIANQCAGLVVGTGDMSELALGWTTYNGDHMSMYGVNASVPKTLIRHLVEYCADETPDAELAAVLRDILATPVSPELLPADEKGEICQKTEEIVGSYELNDFFMFYVLRYGFGPGKILRFAQRAFEDVPREELAERLRQFYRRFFSQQFKRSCLPDGPKIGSVALSPRGDWRMPSDASPAAWLEEL